MYFLQGLNLSCFLPDNYTFTVRNITCYLIKLAAHMPVNMYLSPPQAPLRKHFKDSCWRSLGQIPNPDVCETRAKLADLSLKPEMSSKREEASKT